MTSNPAFHGSVSVNRAPFSICALMLACAACTVEEVSSRSEQPLVTATEVALEVTVVDGRLMARGERLVVADEDRRMRFEGGASVSLERKDAQVEGKEQTLFSARARQLEIDPAASVIRLKGAVHTRFSGMVQSDADAE